MMRGDAVGIDAVRLAGALQRVLVAALLEVATGLLEQIGQRRIGSAFVEAGSRRRQRLRPRIRRARIGRPDHRRGRSPHRRSLLRQSCGSYVGGRGRLLAACRDQYQGDEELAAEHLGHR